MNGAALAQEKTGKAGSAISTSSSAARNGSAAGSIAGEWNAPATSRRMTRVLRSFATASVLSSASMRAGEDDLAGRVVVGDGDAAGLGDLPRVLEARADEGQHRAVAGLAHQAAAQDDELERVVALEHAGGDERGQLAERVAGAEARAQVERVPADHRGAEDRGLCEAGVLLHAGEGVLADELSHLLKQLGRALGNQVAHVGGMAPLAREERRGLCCVAHTCTITDGRAPSHPPLSALPPGRGVRHPSSRK